MKYNFLSAAILCCVGLGSLSSCKDDFSMINQDPSAISTPNIRYLFTQCAMSFQPADYWQWYGGFVSMSAWSQAAVMSGGNTSQLNLSGGSGCGYGVNEILKYANEIKYQISLLPAGEKEKFEYIQYLSAPLLVYIGMEDSDMFGSRQYSEAEMIRYGGTLTPKYDKQEELFEQWLNQLNEATNYLNAHKGQTDMLGAQDFIYKGKIDKWAKLANSMKLKVAARLINVDKARAIAIVNEAMSNEAGLITSVDDDFIMNKGKESNNFNNDPLLSAGNKTWINFMKDNEDPRLFYFYMKNQYNSNVIQAFFDQKREKHIPSYIMEKVEFKEEDGKKTFTGWKAPGEPWVRYHGIPCVNDAKDKPEYAEYFDPKQEAFWLESKSGTKVNYSPTIVWNKFSIKGKYKYDFPDAPDVPPVQTQDYAWYGLYFSAGEVNLLLAEFKLLGANVPKTAQEYFTAGIELSVRAHNKVAGLNHLPYYDSPYSLDKFDKTINTTENMISAMLTHDVYKLNGSQEENLEKIYIQQMIHYNLLPMDQFVTFRRSGVPMKNSRILPYENFEPTMSTPYIIPRRFAVGEPDKADKLYEVTIAAYMEQGYTYSGIMSSAPETLDKERIWYDKKSPEYGAGPLVK